MTDIVIINWNSADFLEKCVNSIFTTKNKAFVNTVFIIDNNSSDSSLERIEPHDKIRIIRNEENLGFAKACNQGFKLCHSTYVLLLNPDTQLLDDTLKDCAQFMDTHPNVDILGCQLLNEEGEITSSCARFPTPLHIFYDASGLSKIAPSLFKPTTLMTDWNHQTSQFVPQVMGAFMWMRPSLFEKIGFFDEQFFVYFEELDFSKRLAESGGHTFYNAQIKSIHSGEGTTNAVKAFRLYLFWLSRLQYAKKHFTAFGYSIGFLATYLIEPISRWILLFLKGDFKGMKEVAKGYQYLIKKKNQF
jgi:GT2 family glycosyltransferase